VKMAVRGRPEVLSPASLHCIISPNVCLSQDTLEEVCQHPDAVRRETVRRARCEAFAMGHQERLGAGSRVRWLDAGVVRMVLEQTGGVYTLVKVASTPFNFQRFFLEKVGGADVRTVSLLGPALFLRFTPDCKFLILDIDAA